MNKTDERLQKQWAKIRKVYLGEVVPANIAISRGKCAHPKFWDCVGGKFCQFCGKVFYAG
jgi:hypothetical protein